MAISGIDLTGILLNVIPTTEVEPPDDWTPRPVPSSTQLVVAEAARATRRTVDSMTQPANASAAAAGNWR